MKRMKSNQVRRNWRDVLDTVRAGGSILVEYYNRPIARIVPAGECAHGVEDPEWWDAHPNWSPLQIPPREAWRWCNKPGTHERNELYYCDEHAAEWDSKYGGDGSAVTP